MSVFLNKSSVKHNILVKIFIYDESKDGKQKLLRAIWGKITIKSSDIRDRLKE